MATNRCRVAGVADDEEEVHENSALEDGCTVADGLRLLGMRSDTDTSVFHEWSAALPAGTFDAYRSVVPAPDHLFFNGVTVNIMRGCMQAVPGADRELVSCSLREALALSGLRRTRPYNVKSGHLNSLTKSEWSAVLTVAPVCFQRALPTAVLQVRDRETPLQVVLSILEKFCSLVRATYFYPRVVLDGADACHSAPNVDVLQRQASAFLAFVDTSMRRRDCVPFVSCLDKPNLHRLREVYSFVLPRFLHIRHVRELFFESAHQPLKQAALSGNGHDDARRAFSRMLETESFSRVATDPAKFNLPQHYCEHPGISKQLKEAAALYTRVGQEWRVASGVLVEIPEAARAVAAHHCSAGYEIPWRKGATRGNSDYIRVGDTVSVLCPRDREGIWMVPVASPEEAAEHGAAVRFFRTNAFYASVSGHAIALVHPFLRSDADLWTVDVSRTLSLTLSSCVRRSLALHACEGDCDMASASTIQHGAAGEWHLFGRASLYPAVSG